MKKLKLGLILVGILCTFYGYAQEEFFGKNAGLNLSYGTSNIKENYTGGLSFYTQKSWIFSLAYSHLYYNTNPLTVSVGYLKDITKQDKEIDTKIVIGLTSILGTTSQGIIPGYFGPNLGISFTFYPKSDFPFFLGAATYAYFGLINLSEQGIYSGVTLNYTQAFFKKNDIYPFIGISKSFNFLYQSSDNLYFRAGLNIKLSEPDKAKKEIQ